MTPPQNTILPWSVAQGSKLLWVVYSCVLCTVLVLLSDARAQAQFPDEPQAAVVISLQIRPYVQALDGIREELRRAGRPRVDVFFQDADANRDQNRLAERLGKGGYGVLIAVGPEATLFIWDAFPAKQPLKVFCMVLNPENILKPTLREPACGVPLNIPMYNQLGAIVRHLPTFKRIGMIYDPAHNAVAAREAELAGQRLGVSIVHLKIMARSQIMPVLQTAWQNIDALWMVPDRTVISESLIPFIIKEGLSNNVAVLGYNRFFTESGAALALSLDYTAIGRQAAGLVAALLAGEACRPAVPAHDVLVNKEALAAMGVRYGEPQPFKAPGGEAKP